MSSLAAVAAVAHLGLTAPAHAGWNVWAESLGGSAAHGTAVVTRLGADHLDVFATGSHGQLIQTWYSGGWKPWVSHGGNFCSGPAATSPVYKRADVFVLGCDGDIWRKTYVNNAWRGWEVMTIEGGSLSAPAVSGWGTSNFVSTRTFVDLFTIGSDGRVRWTRFVNDQRQATVDLGGTFRGSPAAVTSGLATSNGDIATWIDLFAVEEPTGRLMHNRRLNGAWSGWSATGRLTTQSPAATRMGSNRVDLFVEEGLTGGLLHGRFEGGTWRSWETLSGEGLPGMSAASWSTNRVDLFGLSGDAVLHGYHK